MNAPEPESVKALVAQMQAARLSKQGNGEQTDTQIVARIYAEFRWGLKKAGMIGQVTTAVVETMIETAIKRVRKEVKDPVLQAQAAEKYVEAKKKLAAWADDEKLRKDVCERTSLPRFLCPHCQEKSY